jgi:hypothetical protein
MATTGVTFAAADWGELFTSGYDGTLTDEHSASSYGIPVIVRDDGQVLSLAEAPDAIVSRNRGAEVEAMIERALANGMRLAEQAEIPEA